MFRKVSANNKDGDVAICYTTATPLSSFLHTPVPVQKNKVLGAQFFSSWLPCRPYGTDHQNQGTALRSWVQIVMNVLFVQIIPPNASIG
jgi:hypothetical protein